MSIDRLDHVAHVDDLDLVNDAALADPLQTAINAPETLQVITTSDFTPYSNYFVGGVKAFVRDSQSTINQFASTRLTLMKA